MRSMNLSKCCSIVINKTVSNQNEVTSATGSELVHVYNFYFRIEALILLILKRSSSAEVR